MTEEQRRAMRRSNYAAQMEGLGYDASGNPLPVKKEQQQEPMEKPAVYYMSHESKYPDQIRLSFPDGKTIVYDRRIKQPSPKKYLNMPRHAKRG